MRVKRQGTSFAGKTVAKEIEAAVTAAVPSARHSPGACRGGRSVSAPDRPKKSEQNKRNPHPADTILPGGDYLAKNM